MIFSIAPALHHALIEEMATVEAVIANEPPAGGIREKRIRFDIACKTALPHKYSHKDSKTQRN